MTPEYADASEQSTKTSNSNFRHPTSPFEWKKKLLLTAGIEPGHPQSKSECAIHPISHGESTKQDSKFVDLDFCPFFLFLGFIFKARIFFMPLSFFNYFFFKYLLF
jgi:hypothetical protein